jgi:GlpG protein
LDISVTWIFVKRLPLENDLSELSRFLRGRGLEHRIIENQGAQVVEVRDPAAVEALSRLIDEYLAGSVELPDAAPEREAVQGGLSPWQTPVTLLIIALSIIGCLMVETTVGQAWLSWFTFQGFDSYQLLPLSEGIFAGQFWRLVTPAFLHFGFFHLLFNSLWLWDLGRRMELGVGRSHYLLFVVASAVVSNVAQYIWGGPGLFGGMSGVVYGLVGFVWLRQYSDPNPLFAVPKAVIGFMLFWLVLCMSGMVDYFIAGSVANAAHVGGLLAGMAWGAISARKNTGSR